MIKRTILVIVFLVACVAAWFFAVGKGWVGGGAWEPAPVAAGPRATPVALDDTPQILFGDLHTHTNYSLDAYIFNTELVKGLGVVTPADACDFARYCSVLDFWSINDHAEGLTPRVWADTVDSVRDCNAASGSAANPDMVSFVGWEWSNSNRDDIPSHYGHKNVIFRSWDEGQTPTRPIASEPSYIFTKVPSIVLGLLSLVDGLKATGDFGWYLEESRNVPICPEGIPADELPDNCREVAATPKDLYRKLDEWGFDSMVIPHGLAWGTTNPLTADFRDQLDQYESRYQKLIETFSGHGNSERFEEFYRTDFDENGVAYCPPATENFTPCCRQAGAITRANCDDPSSDLCNDTAMTAMDDFAQEGAPAGRKLFPEATLDDWAGCGQLQNTFQPAAMYVPRQSTQYNLALGFDEAGNAKRTKFGLIGSSDNHAARPGSSYKELNRAITTDNKSVKGGAAFSLSADEESSGFFYTGGLVAVHASGRDRDAIWSALDKRQVYATSGDRMLVWFDLLNAPEGEVPMGSEVTMTDSPRFRVKALGAFEQQPGCPDSAVAALGRERVEALCGGECYQPGDKRKAITRIEIVRIRPQVLPEEAISTLIDHQWQVFDCPGDGMGCSVEFEDPEYSEGERAAVYYARVIQEAEPLIAGDPFGCDYDDEGNCISRTYCMGENAPADEDCTTPAEPRAWSSPIFLEYSQP